MFSCDQVQNSHSSNFCLIIKIAHLLLLIHNIRHPLPSSNLIRMDWSKSILIEAPSLLNQNANSHRDQNISTIKRGEKWVSEGNKRSQDLSLLGGQMTRGGWQKVEGCYSSGVGGEVLQTTRWWPDQSKCLHVYKHVYKLVYQYFIGSTLTLL